MPIHPHRTTVAHVVLSFLLISSSLAQADEQYWIYTVRPGDTIWDLTERHTTNVLHWQRIQKLNNIPDGPDRSVPPGTRLRFPISMLKHQPAQAEITEVYGEITITRADGTVLTNATQGLTLASGDRVKTGAASNLVIRFADGSELLVAANSDIQMDSLSAYGDTGMVDTRIRLQGGQVDTQVQPSRGPGSRYEIITPAAVAAVRGTDFRVSAEQDAAVARSEVLEGTVAVSGSGKPQSVPQGFGLRAEAGIEPDAPRPLLPAPDLSALNTLQQRLPLNFSWPAVEGAQAYRLQIAPDTKFRQLLVDEVTPAARAFWKQLPDGDYVLRVRSIDGKGLEGFNAIQQIRVDAHPEPPLLLGPNNAAVVHEASPEFSWSQPEGADAYRLQIAQDENFSTLLIDQPAVRKTRFVPSTPLAAGDYYWRLATRVDGDQGPFSDTQKFTYYVLPESPALQAPAMDKNTLAFNWASAGEGLSYQFQFASDPDFKHILHEQTTREPAVSIARPKSQLYYFRVRAIDASGYAGPFGTTQQIDVPPGSYWPLLIPLVVLFL